MSNRPLSFKRQAIRFSTASLPHSSSSKILSTRSSSSEPVRSSSPHSSARNTASDDCKPCALAVTLGISSLSCARSIKGFKDLSAHHCDCVGAAARGRHIVSSPPGDVDVFTLERFGIGIENFRRSAPPAGFRAESLSALDRRRACDACGLLARWGRARPTRIAIFAPLSPLPAGRLNTFQWRSIADSPIDLYQLRLGFEQSQRSPPRS
jgi:hypothetical protein